MEVYREIRLHFLFKGQDLPKSPKVTALPLNCFQGLLGWKQNDSSFRDTFYFDYEGILDDNSASCDDGFLQLAKTI